jgi:hypothetical protein
MERLIVAFLISSLMVSCFMVSCFMVSARPSASIQNVDLDMTHTVTPATPTYNPVYIFHNQMRKGNGDASAASMTYNLHVKRNTDASGITTLYTALGLRRVSATDDQFANATYVLLLNGGEATATVIWWEDGVSQIMTGTIAGTDYTVFGVAQVLAPTNAVDFVPANNVQAAGTLWAVSCKEDITGNGLVDIFDQFQMANAFGSTPGSPRWNPDADLMPDGVIDMFDVNMVARIFNWHSGYINGTPTAIPEIWPLKVQAYHANFSVPVYSDYVVYSNTWSFDSVSRQFSFDVTSWIDAFCDVTIPATLMSGDFSVYLDGVPAPFEVSTNVTHYFIYFTSTGLNHRVTIESTIVGAHDVAVTNVASSKTAVGQGMSDSINATVTNQGDYTETFNVTTFANATVVGSENVTLPAGDSTTVMFNWNTTGFDYGNYTISATAGPVADETNIGDNTFTDGTVSVTIPGDINLDGLVDIFDAIKLAGAFGSKPPNPNFNPNADINGDGIVDIFDALLLAGHYGQHYP